MWEYKTKVFQFNLIYCREGRVVLNLLSNVIREGVRGVAGVASATPYFGHIRIGST